MRDAAARVAVPATERRHPCSCSWQAVPWQQVANGARRSGADAPLLSHFHLSLSPAALAQTDREPPCCMTGGAAAQDARPERADVLMISQATGNLSDFAEVSGMRQRVAAARARAAGTRAGKGSLRPCVPRVDMSMYTARVSGCPRPRVRRPCKTACAHRHRQIDRQTHSDRQTHTHGQTDAHARTDRHARTHARAHARTHTHRYQRGSMRHTRDDTATDLWWHKEMPLIGCSIVM